MKVLLQDLSPELEGLLKAALQTLEAETAPAPLAEFLLVFGSEGEVAERKVEEFAARLPEPAQWGADRLALGQAIWVLPDGTATPLTARLQAMALAHAPKMRVNALHLGTALPPAAAHHAAWQQAQPAPPPKSVAERLADALNFLCKSPALTGQILHLGPL